MFQSASLAGSSRASHSSCAASRTRRVEGEEPGSPAQCEQPARLLERVVAVPVHVEEGVVALVGVVVVPEHGVKRHSGQQQRFVGLLEALPEVARAGRPFVDVVAEHDHEVVREAFAVLGHPPAELVLLGAAAAAVADHREADRARLVRHGQLAWRGEPRLGGEDPGPFTRLCGLAAGRERERREQDEDGGASHGSTAIMWAGIEGPPNRRDSDHVVIKSIDPRHMIDALLFASGPLVSTTPS